MIKNRTQAASSAAVVSTIRVAGTVGQNLGVSSRLAVCLAFHPPSQTKKIKKVKKPIGGLYVPYLCISWSRGRISCCARKHQNPKFAT